MSATQKSILTLFGHQKLPKKIYCQLLTPCYLYIAVTASNVIANTFSEQNIWLPKHPNPHASSILPLDRSISWSLTAVL
jgi:hypothetical protein